MTPEQHQNVKKWIEALRSGKYKQTAGCLHDSHGHCCLGVACEAYLKEHPEGLSVESRQTGDFENNTRYAYDTREADLPEVVMEWLGLRSSFGNFQDAVRLVVDGSPITMNDLSDLNDSDDPKYTFDDIANLLEQELETHGRGMFVNEVRPINDPPEIVYDP